MLLALALGWIEGSVVVYLRQVYDQQAGSHAPMFPLVFLSDPSVLDGEPARVYRLTDAAVLFASACTIVAAFLGDWRLAVGQQVPERFHAWLFWAGVAVGTIWFVRVERGVGGSTRPARHIMR